MIKFFSILNKGDDHHLPFYNNFIEHLKKFNLEKDHELIMVDGDSGPFKSEEFISITYKKLDHVCNFLRDGHTVFLSDLDIVFLRDPIPYLEEQLQHHDIAIQTNQYKGEIENTPSIKAYSKNTGFYMVKPSDLLIDFFDTTEKLHPWDSDPTDQGYINQKSIQKWNKYQKIKCKTLDRNLFPFGKWWYEHSQSIPDPYIVHYNWIWRLERKIERMKEFGHWIVE